MSLRYAFVGLGRVRPSIYLIESHHPHAYVHVLERTLEEPANVIFTTVTRFPGHVC